MPMILKIPVIYGSIRSARQGIKAARFIERQLRARGHEVTLVDPAELQVPLLDRMFKEYPPGHGSGGARATRGALSRSRRVRHRHRRVQPQRAAGLVQPARPLPGGVFLPAVGDRELLGRYLAGVRAAMQLRAMPCELGMPSIPSTFPVPKVGSAFTDDGSAMDLVFDKRFVRFATELEWYAEALKERRKGGVPY